MFAYPLRTAALGLAAIVGLSACTTPYGYSGVSMGVGNAGYYDPYYGYGYGAGYPGYGYGYGYPGYSLAYAPYWGWNDGFYYPGTGYYVYDHYRHRHHWTDAQRLYWQTRRDQALATGTTSQPVVIRENWNDFKRHRSSEQTNRIERQSNRSIAVERTRPIRVERQQVEQSQTVRVARPDRVQRESVGTERSAARLERQETREQRKSEIRAERTSRGNGRGRGTGED